MPTEQPVHEVLLSLLRTFGIGKVHLAGRLPADWRGLAENAPECIASLTLLQPSATPVGLLRSLGPRVTTLSQTDNFCGGGFPRLLENGATHVPLQGSGLSLMWSDVATGNKSALLKSLRSAGEKFSADSMQQGGSWSGVLDGVSYTVLGSGPCLVLLPLGYAPSGWASVTPELSETFSVILLGGARLGMIPILEDRGTSPPFQAMIRNLVDRLNIPDNVGCRLLEVGSGSGVLLRDIKRLRPQVSLVGVDFSPYLVAESKVLAAQAEITSDIQFEVGNGENLSTLEDCSFDAVMSVSVAQQLNADKLITEMVRVCKPGGWIGVIVRAEDIPSRVNVPLPREEIESFQSRGRDYQDCFPGCSTSSLYQRLCDADLGDMTYGPHFMVSTDAHDAVGEYMIGNYVSTLEPSRNRAWTDAITEATENGTFYIAWPYHIASARKPLRD